MAFTATINTIKFELGEVQIEVTYLDSATGFIATRKFTYPSDGSVTQATAVNDIKSIGSELKANLAVMTNLLSKVGTVITIT